MEVTHVMKERERFQKVMLDIFQQEIQTLSPELRSILIDDVITVFHNRLTFLKKIQYNKEMQLHENDSPVPEPKWLTEDIKKNFKYEVSIKKNGLRVTKLTTQNKKR
jgi:hypothetical protein